MGGVLAPSSRRSGHHSAGSSRRRSFLPSGHRGLLQGRSVHMATAKLDACRLDAPRSVEDASYRPPSGRNGRTRTRAQTSIADAQWRVIGGACHTYTRFRVLTYR